MDNGYYLSENPDVAAAVANGAFNTGFEHFVQFGWLEGRDGSILFNEEQYLETNPDVAGAVDRDEFSSGFQHFALFGHLEGRDPSTLFSQDDYLAANQDVAAAVSSEAFASGLAHYLQFGHLENRDASPIFDPQDYLVNNPDVQAAVTAGTVLSAFEHFLEAGAQESRLPVLLFEELTYLQRNPDVAGAVANGELPSGYIHYVSFGQAEGRDPSVIFDESAYLAANPQIRVLIDDYMVGIIAGILADAGHDPEELVVAGFDLHPDWLPLMRAGHIDLIVDQQPYLQGYLAVWQLAMSIRHGFSGLHIDTGRAFVHRGNLDRIETLIDRGIRFENTFRTIYLLPMSLSFVVTAQFWLWMYNYDNGMVNAILRSVGVSEPPKWIGDPQFVLAAVIIALVWQFSGYAMVVYLAALRAIPSAQFEAARVDGASTVRMYWRVIVPQLKTATISAMVVLMVFALKAFDFLYSLVGGYRPPNGADILATKMVREAYQNTNWAYGSAIAVILFLMALAVIGPYLTYQYRNDNL